MRHRSFLVALSLFASVLTAAGAEPDSTVISHGRPLDLPMSFASSYGELRHDHFHAGLDLRTGGRQGDPIHSIKDGYVSRVSVSMTGYGNGIYVTHPDGTMSVYGHLQAFRSDIAQRVLREQYERKSYTVNILFSPDEFPVRQGDVIGKVGNTGSSMGPHLHMEVRRDDGNTPFNYFREGYYSVPDTQSPVIQRIAVYAYEDSTGFPVSRRLKLMSGRFPEGVTAVPAKSYIGIDAIDRMDGTTGRLGVERYVVTLDDNPLFEFNVGDVPSGLDSYIRSTIAFGESGMDFIKTQVDPGNLLAESKISAVNGGIIFLEDYERHKVTVEVSDIFGNRTRTSLYLRRDDMVKAEPGRDTTLSTFPMLWYTPNVMITDSISLSMPLGALYNNVAFKYGKVAGKDTLAGFYSPVWQLGDDRLPLHKPFVVSIPVGDDPAVTDRMLLARVGSNGTLSGVGGKVMDGYLKAQVRCGTYCATRDTVPPTLRPSLQSGSRVSGNSFRITARDNLAGISEFEVLLDGEWILSSFRNNIITVYLSEDKVRHGRHEVEASATDAVGNRTVIMFDVIW